MSLVVCIAREPEPAAREVLRAAAGPDVDLRFGNAPDCITLVEGVVSAERVDACPALTTVIIPWAGVPAQTREVLRTRPHLRLHNVHHNAGPAAEMALTLYLAAAKSILPRDRELRQGDWSNRARMELALGVEGRHAVVWGCGAIGSRVAAMCRALRMSVTEVARMGRGGVRGTDELNDLLPSADALFVCVPLTDETRGRIGARELAALPEQAVLVNVARGAVIDEAALHEALVSRRLFGAGLDVWWRYPERGETQAPPSAHPFHELDNVVMSPHRGGHVLATERLRMQALGEALRSQAEGRPIPHPVDPDLGY
ncbi:hydroxyacid dehydrogenase [bacterium]|nr:hydroxyacid dehydrogenase [bacterium]